MEGQGGERAKERKRGEERRKEKERIAGWFKKNQRAGGRRREQTGGTQRILRAVKTLCMAPEGYIHVIIYLSKPTENTPPRVNPSIDYGLWVIKVCQYKSISCNKCTSLVGDY